jgi:hypothetical protein
MYREEEKVRKTNAGYSLLAQALGTNDDPEMPCNDSLFCTVSLELPDLTKADKPQKEEWEGASQELGIRMGKTRMANPGQR